MRILGVIPARYASTRFPGKPLALIAGKPLLLHVIQRCQTASTLSDIVVATDDERIAALARKHCRVFMTRADHPSGTDRIAEVSEHLEADGYVNIQGDEPLICPSVIQAVADGLAKASMATAATLIHDMETFLSPNCVKVVVDRDGFALYFSRHPIPFLREASADTAQPPWDQFPYRKHLGIYAYTRDTLRRIVSLPVSTLERAERLEQLRPLENGFRIAVATVSEDAVGVDVPADVDRVERLLAEAHSQAPTPGRS